jgi:hypothetical protein
VSWRKKLDYWLFTRRLAVQNKTSPKELNLFKIEDLEPSKFSRGTGLRQFAFVLSVHYPNIDQYIELLKEVNNPDIFIDPEIRQVQEAKIVMSDFLVSRDGTIRDPVPLIGQFKKELIQAANAYSTLGIADVGKGKMSVFKAKAMINRAFILSDQLWSYQYDRTPGS